MNNSQLSILIEKILDLDSVWYANYYAGSMKKQPHGGVAHVLWPNYYIRYFQKQLFSLFAKDPDEIAFFMEKAVDEVLLLESKSNVDIDIILRYFCDTDFWYTGYRILKPKSDYKEMQHSLFFNVVDKKLSFIEFFEIDERKVIYAFLCYLLECNKVKIEGLCDIERHEELSYDHNKYGLSNISDADFKRQGFIYDNKYFLYNIFFDTSIAAPLGEFPATIEIIFGEIDKPKLEMRLDNKLAVPVSKMVSTATADSQIYRGINLNFTDIEKLIYKKEVIVHFCPDTMNKIVMIIKEDTDNGAPFYHIEVEELWNPECVRDDFVIINFIHAKYYPITQNFNHIDFSANQYKKSIYDAKYMDSPNSTGVPIDKYCDTHYKIWCVEADSISIGTWSKLVSLTLDEPFRSLFFEMFEFNSD